MADGLHDTRVIVVVKCYLMCHISTWSPGVAAGIPILKYAQVIPWMAITPAYARIAIASARVAGGTSVWHCIKLHHK
jgi:hypothetical protein